MNLLEAIKLVPDHRKKTEELDIHSGLCTQ